MTTASRTATARLQVPRGWGVPLVIVLILAGVAAVSPADALASLRFTAEALLGIAPFLALSVGFTAYAKASGADALIARAFSGHTAGMVVAGALMGALSPFCSCGVIPIIAALLAMGVPLPAVMAFWLASPLMDPSMFALTTGTLGLNFAIAKTVVAILIGLYAGFATQALMARGLFADPLRPGVGNGGCCTARVRNHAAVAWRFWSEPDRRRRFTDTAVSTTLFLGKWLALAFLVESLMLRYVPAETVASTLGGGSWLTVLGATVIGVPAYLNGYAALPLVGGLIDQGMTPGAGMAFLIAGGVTSIPAAIAVWVLARPQVFAAYLGFALTGALAAGFAYGMLAG
ncbi:MAG: permease [Rhodospirillaceae bacterium]|nr:permease [Rhodospirillaceae bacterium]